MYCLLMFRLSGSFSLLACLISMWHVTSHLRHLHNPDVQRRILAILWMVPIYSVTSWLALVFSSAQPFLSAFRDCYEAYVVYTFIALLIAILAKGKGMQEVIQIIAAQQVQTHAQSSSQVTQRTESNEQEEETKGDMEAAADIESSPEASNAQQNVLAPCPCCIPQRVKQQRNNARAIAASTLWQCQTMAIQFVLLKPLLAVAPFVIRLCGVKYDEHSPIHDGNIDWTSPRLYVLIVANISVSFAFYGLLSFYHIAAKELAWCDPWPKFLCIKGVVFFSFWQDILLQIMSGWGLIDSTGASQIQNLLICIEMFMASIAHFYVFPHHEWKKGYQKAKSVSLTTTLALPDFVTDVRQIASRRGWEPDDESIDGGRRRRGSSIASYGSLGRTSPGHEQGHSLGTGHILERAGSPGSVKSSTLIPDLCHTMDSASGTAAHTRDKSNRSLENEISQLTTSTHTLNDQPFCSPMHQQLQSDSQVGSDTPLYWFVSPTLSHQSTTTSDALNAAAIAALARSPGRRESGVGIDMLSVASSPHSRAPSPFHSDLSNIDMLGDRNPAAFRSETRPVYTAQQASVSSCSGSSSTRRKSPDVILHGSSDDDSSEEEDSNAAVSV